MNDQAGLTGTCVLITGASRGIGRACAIAFAERGARVAVHYGSNRAAAEHTLGLLAGKGHIAVQADITDASAVHALVEDVAAGFGRIDVLVKNAGIFEEHPLPQMDYDGWQAAWSRILSTNLIGAANATYCAAQHMIAQGGGRIITISSRTAFRGKPEAPGYAASKAALNAMSQSLSVALAPHGIYVFVIAPGVVDTDMAANDKDSPAWAAIEQQSPLGRVCQPEEVARTAVFLASPGVEYLTGGIIDLFGAAYLRT
ncbi:MAG: SDR family oxidoreductase [Anaerolineae bacterium]|nr:SDR family oxidoreductase [Anaerolineae bacterium]